MPTPMHPDDYHLLGITWNGHTYLDRALPFGLRSAPKIFSAVADFIAWVLHQNGIAHQLHYLDDFLLLGAPHSEEAHRALETVLNVLRTLGIPIAVHKTEGPDTVLVFLGIDVDTTNFELRLPEVKLTRLRGQLLSWSTKKSCRRRELESLLGHLSHASTVVRHGQTFLRQLFSSLGCVRSNHHFIPLNAGAREDILWWKVFLPLWNGRSFFQCKSPSRTDASGSFGCGAFSLENGWFQLEWPESWSRVHIAAKELVPMVIAAALWGPHWHGSCILFRTDNMAVVEVLRSHSAHDPLLMHLLRCLVFYASVHHFVIVGEHIAGVHNAAADVISRNNLALFSSMFPQVPHVPIPQSVRDLLVEIQPDWGSHRWTDLFKSSWTRASPSQPGQSTDPAGSGTANFAANTVGPHSRSPSPPYASSQQ